MDSDIWNICLHLLRILPAFGCKSINADPDSDAPTSGFGFEFCHPHHKPPIERKDHSSLSMTRQKRNQNYQGLETNLN